MTVGNMIFSIHSLHEKKLNKTIYKTLDSNYNS